VIVDKTIFHPQGGGQPNDEGVIKAGDSEFIVESLKANGDYISHIGKFTSEEHKFAENQEVDLKIDGTKRKNYARVHSAGHLIDIGKHILGK
jgi:Ser-tRNA(Ala) deacylase AlaX